jgi:hypothetical protein
MLYIKDQERVKLSTLAIILIYLNKTQNLVRDRALVTCGDGPVHGYFFLPKIFTFISNSCIKVNKLEDDIK